ncbi:3'-5' exonuclease [Spirulina sp. 06S082]|uniref:3'-5' exonuclease n=1 Tax=Spirulina sp. 06S082 TaxID=3110248 RepID=UPI002B216C2A|nr:3'-5' exonuclease [Spirulina sp. 06S082]MEA5469369.1 3'-5' exonuclease [Spirulina sp. 06S082]
MVKLDRLLVIDIEATCWKKGPPPEQENEIIEIGIAPIDLTTRTIEDKVSILVKPQCSTVSEFCTELTTLTQEQVDTGISFADACLHLRKQYLSEKRVWASYGDYDRRMFAKQCQARGLRYPFGVRHLNVKTLLAIAKSLPREVGMARALEMLDLPLEGTHHRGHDDAWNIARILMKIL